MKKKLVILIPSRNRYELVKKAIKSIEDLNLQNIVDTTVVISDNSDIKYKNFNFKINVKTIIPPILLAMPEHWEWMISQVDADLYCILTDRSFLIPGMFNRALQELIKSELNLISYSFAGYGDHYFPYYVGGFGYTGKVKLVSSISLLEEANQSFYWTAFPRGLNCIFTHSVVEKIRSKYGIIFGGVSPDVNFAFKYLSIFNNLLYFDAPIFLSTAINSSAGRSFVKGEKTELIDWATDNSPWGSNLSGKLPSINDRQVAINYIAHELESLIGLEFFSWQKFYERMERESMHRKKSFYEKFKKFFRPFTVFKSNKLAGWVAVKFFKSNVVIKKYIFE